MTPVLRPGHSDGGGRLGSVRPVAIAVGCIALVHVTLVTLLPVFVCLEHLPEDPPPPAWYVALGAALTPVSWIVAWSVGRGEPMRRRVALGGLAIVPIATFVWLALAAAGVPVNRYCT